MRRVSNEEKMVVYLCKGCSYDLSGLFAGESVRCPECGNLYDPSLLRPFPSVKEYLMMLSVTWVKGLLVMGPLALLLIILPVRFGRGFVIPIFLILVAGVIVIALQMRMRIVQINEFSISVPRYAGILDNLAILFWCCVYWAVVLVPSMILL